MDSKGYETRGGLLCTMYRNVGRHKSRKFLDQLNNCQRFKKSWVVDTVLENRRICHIEHCTSNR